MNDSNIRRGTLIVLTLISLALTGCGATNSLTIQERETIETISISPSDISYEDKKELIYLMTRGRAASSFWGGAIGALIYEANKDKISNPRVLFTRQELIIPYLDEAGNSN